MPVLPNINTESHEDFLANEYKNLQQLVFQYDQAISALLSGSHSSYQIDSGQTSQRVTRLDMPSLISTRKSLLKELESLASRLGLNRNVVVVVPGY